MSHHARIVLSGLLSALLTAATGCGSAEPKLAETPPPEVTISQPVQEDVPDYDEYTGRTEALATVDIRAQVSGYLTKVAFREGDEIKAGALLFEIDPRPYQAALDQAKAQQMSSEAIQKQAKAELARTQQLFATRAASREELDLAIAKQGVSAAEVEKSKAAVEQAQLDLDFTKIMSPIDGKISRALVTEGNLVSAGVTLLTTIVSVDPIYVYFDVDERSLLRYREMAIKREGYKPSQPLKEAKIAIGVGLANEVGYPHDGMLDFAENKVDRTTGTLQVRGVIDNKDRFLTSGLFCRVRVTLEKPTKKLLVNDRAVGTEQTRKYLLLVDDEGKVRRTDVVLGRLNDDGLRVIEEGLKPTDWVIVDGILRARPGMQVNPTKIPMPAMKAASAPNSTATPPANATDSKPDTDNTKDK